MRDPAFEAVVHFLRKDGLPAMLTFDRDPRWVGSSSGRDFPSAKLGFLLCVGIEPNGCPPQREDSPCLRRTGSEKLEPGVLADPSACDPARGTSSD
jgi:hypothetical protein